MQGYPEIHVTFPKAIQGYWNGGAKKGGVFVVSYPFHRDGVEVIEYHSFGMNAGVVVKKLKSNMATAKNAMKLLRKKCSVQGAKWEIVT